MFFSKNKRMKKVSHNNEFMKNCAVKIQGLIELYGEENETVAKALNQLAEDLTFTVPTSDPKAKAKEKNIEKGYEQLAALLKQSDWSEAEAIAIIKDMRLNLTEMNAMRD